MSTEPKGLLIDQLKKPPRCGEKEFERELRIALSPVRFTQSLGIRPDKWQEQVLESESNRIIMCCARQSGKSVISAISSLHTALYLPGQLILLISASHRQSQELFKKVLYYLNKLETRPYLTEENKLSLQLANRSRIVSLPSKGDHIRGYSGVNAIFIDEASRVADELYHALRPMLSVSKGRLVLLSTPYGKRGFFYEQFTKPTELWLKIEVKGTDCPRLSKETLAAEKANLGSLIYSQEYDCQFIEVGDFVFNYADLENCLTDDIEPLFPDLEGPGVLPDYYTS